MSLKFLSFVILMGCSDCSTNGFLFLSAFGDVVKKKESVL